MGTQQRFFRLFRRADGAVLLIVALLACLLWWIGQAQASPGQTAVITTHAGEERIDLSRDCTMTVTGREKQSVTLRVENRRIRFETSTCPDHICVRSGWLSAAGETAACVPAGVSVRVTGDAPVDMIAG